MATWLHGDVVIFDVIKNAVADRWTFKKAFQKEKHNTASQLLKEYANRNWSHR